MKLPLTGGCLCGALLYEIASAPSMAYTCHCTDCQHLTSSAFSLAITVQDSAFRLTKGEPRLLEKIAESGRVDKMGLPGMRLLAHQQPAAWCIRRRDDPPSAGRYARRHFMAQADRAFLDAKQTALGHNSRR